MSFSTSLKVAGETAIISVPKQSKAYGKANSIFVPLGPGYSVAHILLLRSSLTKIQAEGRTYDIEWNQYGDNAIDCLFRGWYLKVAERLLPGSESDPNALYLCTFVDGRYVAANSSSTGNTLSRLMSYANDTTYLDGTDTVTWSDLVGQLWNACGTLGTYPGLPGTLPIDGYPTGNWFIGLNAWDTLCRVLDHLDCAVVHDPFAVPYRIVQLGADQDYPINEKNRKFSGQPFWDNSCLASSLEMYFYYHYQSYGQERDSELTNNWAYDGQYSLETITTGITGANGSQAFHEDLPYLLDEDNTPANFAAVTDRINNRKSRYVTRYNINPRRDKYLGLWKDYLPGGQIKACLWKSFDDGNGTETEFICHREFIPTPDAMMNWGDCDKQIAAEPYSSPDLGRHTYPNYPRIANIVQVHAIGDPDPDAGTTVSPNDDGFHRGKVRRWVANDMEVLEDCWIRFVDSHDTLLGQVDAVQDELYGPARLSGVSTSDDELLPVYLVRQGAAVEAGTPFQYTDSGYDCPAYGVMEVWGEVTIDTVRYLKTRRPTATFNRKYLVNGPTVKTTDQTGKGKWLEKADKVLIDSGVSGGSITLHAEFGVKKDKFGLVDHRPGFHIFDYQTIDTANVATAIQREVTELIGKVTSSAITKGSTGSVDIWMGVGGSEAATTFSPITARATFGAIATSKWCVLSFRNDVWYVAQVEC